MSTKTPVPPPPDNGNFPPWFVDSLARQEERKWPNEDALQGLRDRNRMWALQAVGCVTVILIWFFVSVFVVALSAWIWHQVAPANWLWLSAAQLSKIQSVIFSGAIGAIVSSYVQKHISN